MHRNTPVKNDGSAVRLSSARTVRFTWQAKCVGIGASRPAPGPGLSSLLHAYAWPRPMRPCRCARDGSWNGKQRRTLAQLLHARIPISHHTCTTRRGGADNRRRSVNPVRRDVDDQRHRRSAVSPSWSPGRLDPRQWRPKTNSRHAARHATVSSEKFDCSHNGKSPVEFRGLIKGWRSLLPRTTN